MPGQKRSLLVEAAAIAVLLPGAAMAQNVDYGQFQALFGEPVTASVTGSPQRASQAPADITILTADDIRRSGALDLPGVLKHVEGIDVLQWTHDNADVAVRGYNQPASPRLLVLIDGRQVYSTFYNNTDWPTLPVELDQIQQIEIVKGPNSALFGFNAVGGVINIVTKNPVFDTSGSATISGGTQDARRGSLTAAGSFFGGRAALRIGAGWSANDDFSTVEAAIPPAFRRSPSQSEVNISGHFQPVTWTDVLLEATQSRANYDVMTPVRQINAIQYKTSSVRGQVTFDTPVGLFGGSVYRNWINGVIPSNVVDIENAIQVEEVHGIAKIGGAHTIRVSLEYRDNRGETTPIEGGIVSYGVASASGMWEWTVGPTLTMTNAVRADRLQLHRTGLLPPGYGLSNADWNRQTTELSYNSGLVWRADDADTIRLVAGRGVQSPSLYDLGGLLYALGPNYFGGLPGTPFTKVDNYEVNWARGLPKYGARIEIGLFRTETSPVVAETGGVVGNVIGPVAIGRSSATGVEASASGAFGKGWRWQASYTPEVVDDHFGPQFPLARTALDYEHSQPVHVVKANLGWSGGAWEVDGYLRYESASHGVEGTPPATPQLALIPQYVTVDARVAYRVTDHLILAISGSDLTTARQRQTFGPPVEPRVIASLSLRY